jgi:NADPH:quinone reductase-like Zn-dependent oxidoreductase
MSLNDKYVYNHAQGTWRSSGVFKATSFWKVPKDLPLDAAATLCIK